MNDDYCYTASDLVPGMLIRCRLFDIERFHVIHHAWRETTGMIVGIEHIKLAREPATIEADPAVVYKLDKVDITALIEGQLYRRTNIDSGYKFSHNRMLHFS